MLNKGLYFVLNNLTFNLAVKFKHYGYYYVRSDVDYAKVKLFQNYIMRKTQFMLLNTYGKKDYAHLTSNSMTMLLLCYY